MKNATMDDVRALNRAFRPKGWGLNIKLPPLSEVARDAAWGAPLGYAFTYWPDGTKTLDFPNGKVRLSR